MTEKTLDNWDHSSGDDGQYDVAIVGGGAAGLSAALMLGRALRRVVVVDAGAPRNAPADHMHSFLGHDGMPPRELLEKGRAEISGYGATLVKGTVVGIRPTSGGAALPFDVSIAGRRQLNARRILLAMGSRDVLPDIPGLADLWGRDVHICPYCHGYEVRHQPLAVIATNAHSVPYALLIRNWTSDLIYFEHERGPLSEEENEQLDAMEIRRVPGRIRRVLTESGRLKAIELESGERIERSAIFFGTHLVADTSITEELGVTIRETPQETVIDVDPQGRTSVPGVWAAGNVTNPSLQVVGAAAAGNLAGGAINMELIMEDAAREIQANRARSATSIRT